VDKGPLTSRERTRSAIHLAKPDRVPRGELGLEDAVVMRELGCACVEFEHRAQFAERLGLDIICVASIRPTGSVKGLPDARELLWPNLEKWVNQTDLFTFALLDGPFGWGTRVFGLMEFLSLSLRSPQAFSEFVDQVGRLNLSAARSLMDRGIDGLVMADDLAYSRGLYLNPQVLRERYFPSWIPHAREASERGVPVFFHSDGNVNAVMPDLVEQGFRGFHCVDPHSGMDVRELKGRWGDRLCLWGSVSAENVRNARDEKYFQDLVKRLRLEASEGGFILGTTCGLFQGIDVDLLGAIYKSV